MPNQVFAALQTTTAAVGITKIIHFSPFSQLLIKKPGQAWSLTPVIMIEHLRLPALILTYVREVSGLIVHRA